jgi:hypothetical protein
MPIDKPSGLPKPHLSTITQVEAGLPGHLPAAQQAGTGSPVDGHDYNSCRKHGE